MGYKTLTECVDDLERSGQLVRVKEEIDPHLEMAAVHMRINRLGGPALYFEKLKGCRFPAVSNLFGTIERARFIFRNELEKAEKLVRFRNDPTALIKKPFRHFSTATFALNALPLRKSSALVLAHEIRLSDLPQIKCWPKDGGAFITLPLVYTEHIENPGHSRSNLGMYRIQISGNEYKTDLEAGMHYQIHRGIGVHQEAAIRNGKPLKVSVFVGGSPASILSAVMPLPEGMSELTFAGIMNSRRFRYSYLNGFFVANEADFIIHGEVHGRDTRPEGPFGDHLGYYSLTHPFPYMQVKKVFHREGAIWPFTVVGRPPQEDSIFGKLIHELTGEVLPAEIPGLKELNAVDESGVHPLLIAVGRERYAPFEKASAPQEILTIANRILGTGQLSLSKYVFIATDEGKEPGVMDKQAFFRHFLKRIDLKRDLHFQTNTTIDTLDYSGTGMNAGSKLVLAAATPVLRELSDEIPEMCLPSGFRNPVMVQEGIMAISGPAWKSPEEALKEIRLLCDALASVNGDHFTSQVRIPLIIICDQTPFQGRNAFHDFLWITFTRSNPSHDIYGVHEFIKNKHWGCEGSLVIDARIKAHHAPVLEEDAAVSKSIERFFRKGSSLELYA